MANFKNLTPENKQRVLDAFAHYENAHNELLEAMDAIDCGGSFSQDYPFAGCFEELLMDVRKWEATSTIVLEESEPYSLPEFKGWRSFDALTERKEILEALGGDDVWEGKNPDDITHVYVHQLPMGGTVWITLDKGGLFGSVAGNVDFLEEDFRVVVAGLADQFQIQLPNGETEDLPNIPFSIHRKGTGEFINVEKELHALMIEFSEINLELGGYFVQVKRLQDKAKELLACKAIIDAV